MYYEHNFVFQINNPFLSASIFFFKGRVEKKGVNHNEIHCIVSYHWNLHMEAQGKQGTPGNYCFSASRTRNNELKLESILKMNLVAITHNGLFQNKSFYFKHCIQGM